MFSFIVQRLLQAVIVMVCVAFVAFLLFQYVGDPVLFMLGQDATADQIIALRKDLGLDRSFVIQFFNFLINAVQGEFGISLRQGAALGIQKSLGQLKQNGRLDEDPELVVTFLERQRMVNKPYFDALEKKYTY